MAVTKKKITAVKISTDPNTQYDIDLPNDATPSISQLTVSEGIFAKSLYASGSVSFSGSVYSSAYGFKSGSEGASTAYLDGSITYDHSINGKYTYTFPTDKSGTFALTSDISALNIEGGSGATAVQMLQDGTSGTFDFTDKNPNATALDNTLTGDITYGGTGAYSASFGGKSAAMGKRSFAQGTTTIAKGAYSHAEGDNSVALGNDSHAEGAVNVAAGFASHAEGNTTQATGDNSHSEGNLTVSSALNSHAEGYKTSAVGQSSHAEGSESIAGSTASHAEGNTTIASGVHAHSEGYLTRAYGDNSHAEGYLTIAHGTNSHVEGYSSMVLTSVPSSGESGSGGTSSGTTGTGETPYGQNCHAEGWGTAAIGFSSHAEGNGTSAQGHISHAEGFNCITKGAYTHAEGVGTQALGIASHAEGASTVATYSYSHASGRGTKTGRNEQFVCGTYNAGSEENIFEAGNGVDESSRSNAFEVLADGRAKVHAAPTEDDDVVRKGDVGDQVTYSYNSGVLTITSK